VVSTTASASPSSSVPSASWGRSCPTRPTSLFRLLGYQFSPRLADIGSARFWRITRNADYGPLGGLARHHINTDLIAAHWDDLLRVAGSLATGTVRASELLRVLQGGGQPTPLGRAVAELGRITKTLYLLAYLDDETYRRRILTQLNRTESRHALARAVFHGQRGQLRQRYREGQEDQLGALGLVVNAIVLWNTRYQNAALDQLRRDGHDVRDDDLRRSRRPRRRPTTHVTPRPRPPQPPRPLPVQRPRPPRRTAPRPTRPRHLTTSRGCLAHDPAPLLPTPEPHRSLCHVSDRSRAATRAESAQAR